MLKQSQRSSIAHTKRSRAPVRIVVIAVLIVNIALSLLALHALNTLNLGGNNQGIVPVKTVNNAIQSSGSSALKETPEVSSSPKIISPMGKVFYGVSLDDLTKLDVFERDAMKNPAIVMWYQAWGSTDGTQNFEAARMDMIRSSGSIPLITWEPWKPIDYPQGVDQPAFALRNIIAGKFDSYIIKWAGASRAWNHPYFLRFAQEMNGSWYPWDEEVNGNTSGEFVQAWRHVHDIFTAQGATNVNWVWSPNVEYTRAIPLAEVYPGDSYVDWVGMDGFNWGAASGTVWLTFSQTFQQTYEDLLKMTSKPLMIAEIGCAEYGGSKANWIADALSIQIPKYFPKIKAFIWFNQDKQRDWRIESSASAQSAFANAVQLSIYASNTFGKY